MATHYSASRGAYSFEFEALLGAWSIDFGGCDAEFLRIRQEIQVPKLKIRKDLGSWGDSARQHGARDNVWFFRVLQFESPNPHQKFLHMNHKKLKHLKKKGLLLNSV